MSTTTSLPTTITIGGHTLRLAVVDRGALPTSLQRDDTVDNHYYITETVRGSLDPTIILPDTDPRGTSMWYVGREIAGHRGWHVRRGAFEYVEEYVPTVGDRLDSIEKWMALPEGTQVHYDMNGGPDYWIRTEDGRHQLVSDDGGDVRVHYPDIAGSPRGVRVDGGMRVRALPEKVPTHQGLPLTIEIGATTARLCTVGAPAMTGRPGGGLYYVVDWTDSTDTVRPTIIVPSEDPRHGLLHPDATAALGGLEIPAEYNYWCLMTSEGVTPVEADNQEETEQEEATGPLLLEPSIEKDGRTLHLYELLAPPPADDRIPADWFESLDHRYFYGFSDGGGSIMLVEDDPERAPFFFDRYNGVRGWSVPYDIANRVTEPVTLVPEGVPTHQGLPITVDMHTDTGSITVTLRNVHRISDGNERTGRMPGLYYVLSTPPGYERNDALIVPLDDPRSESMHRNAPHSWERPADHRHWYISITDSTPVEPDGVTAGEVTEVEDDRVRIAEQRHARDMEIITEILSEQARRRQWCSEYEEVLEQINARTHLNLGPRTVREEQTWRVSFDVPIALTADTQAEITAQARVLAQDLRLGFAGQRLSPVSVEQHVDLDF